MNSSATRLGIVGAGYWGPNLIRECVNQGVLDSVCDIDQAALGAIKTLYPQVETVSEFGALLARPIGAVIIAAPAQLHAAMCLQAIRAGKAVFVEKPLALTISDGQQIADAAHAAGVVVCVGHLLIYHPGVKKLRAMLTEGAIGRLWHMRSRRLGLGRLRTHESVWWSFAPHDVALMLAIMGAQPSAVVAAQGARREAGVCDVAYADFEFEGGRSAHLEVCWLDPEKSARLDVFGDAGVLTLTDSRHGSALSLRRFSIAAGAHGAPTVAGGEQQAVSFSQEEPLKLEIEAFLQALRTGVPTETSAAHGVAVLKALTMADEAARAKEEVTA